ncbi:MAG: hypothetical protein PVI66_05410 [Candidatus Aminicenantes bacterium]
MILESKKKIAVCLLFISLSAIPGLSQTFDIKSLVSSWGVVGVQKSSEPQLGIRFIPELFLEKSLSRKITLDANISLNTYGVATFKSNDNVQSESDIKPYRLWARFSSSQFEVRLGLQKISFGSASLLRPLMWFDRLDPRDPLQLTEGVYALLFRYYFVSNTNIWVWGLYGNDDPKGWETFPSDKKTPEFGGRVQVPLFSGELAFSYHHRTADINRGPFEGLFPVDNLIQENRFGCDGKWDVTIGVWIEATLTHQESVLLPYPWQRALNAGLDYTFGIGNGLYALGEHLILTQSKETWNSGKDTNFSCFLCRYPFGIMDDLTVILYYDWENEEFYRFINWQRTYDKWMFNIIGFWNPEEFLLYPTQAGNNPFVGKGFQIMVTFNF